MSAYWAVLALNLTGFDPSRLRRVRLGRLAGESAVFLVFWLRASCGTRCIELVQSRNHLRRLRVDRVTPDSGSWLNCRPLETASVIFCVICSQSWSRRCPSSAVICISWDTLLVQASSASGTERTVVNFAASSDHNLTSDFTRASQARPAFSYASRNSFCRAIPASTGIWLMPKMGVERPAELVKSLIAMTLSPPWDRQFSMRSNRDRLRLPFQRRKRTRPRSPWRQ